MFQWLFRRRAGFQLPSGKYADPLFAYRNLLANNVDGLLDKLSCGDRHAEFAAHVQLCQLGRESFGMVPFNPHTGEGDTDEDVMTAISEFAEYCAKKGWAARPSPIKSPPTESTES